MIREVCEQILRLLRPDLDSKYQIILFWYFLWYLLVLKCNPWIYFLIVKGPLDSILMVYSKPAQLQKLLTAPVNLGAMARWPLTTHSSTNPKLYIGISVNNLHLLDIQMGKISDVPTGMPRSTKKRTASGWKRPTWAHWVWIRRWQNRSKNDSILWNRIDSKCPFFRH